jgi:hypothetical protein
MTLLALLLVLGAALLHASWNLLAKRSGGGLAVTWLFGLISALVYAPLGLALWWRSAFEVGWLELYA